jgi:hypothetical protein
MRKTETGSKRFWMRRIRHEPTCDRQFVGSHIVFCRKGQDRGRGATTTAENYTPRADGWGGLFSKAHFLRPDKRGELARNPGLESRETWGTRRMSIGDSA